MIAAGGPWLNGRHSSGRPRCNAPFTQPPVGSSPTTRAESPTTRSCGAPGAPLHALLVVGRGHEAASPRPSPGSTRSWPSWAEPLAPTGCSTPDAGWEAVDRRERGLPARDPRSRGVRPPLPRACAGEGPGEGARGLRVLRRRPPGDLGPREAHAARPRAGARRLLREALPEAAVSLKRVLQVDPGDKTAQLYLRNAARDMVDGVEDGWTGVERMTEKQGAALASARPPGLPNKRTAGVPFDLERERKPAARGVTARPEGSRGLAAGRD